MTSPLIEAMEAWKAEAAGNQHSFFVIAINADSAIIFNIDFAARLIAKRFDIFAACCVPGKLKIVLYQWIYPNCCL